MIGICPDKEDSMIGKRIALAVTVAVLGVGLSLAPASVAVAKKCPPPKKVAKCKHEHKIAADCKHKAKADKPACKMALKAAVLADCHTCGTSPSGAFLDID